MDRGAAHSYLHIRLKKEVVATEALFQVGPRAIVVRSNKRQIRAGTLVQAVAHTSGIWGFSHDSKLSEGNSQDQLASLGFSAV